MHIIEYNAEKACILIGFMLYCCNCVFKSCSCRFVYIYCSVCQHYLTQPTEAGHALRKYILSQKIPKLCMLLHGALSAANLQMGFLKTLIEPFNLQITECNPHGKTTCEYNNKKPQQISVMEVNNNFFYCKNPYMTLATC